MRQPAHHHRLGQQRLDRRRVPLPIQAQGLDGHVALQLGVVGQPDLALRPSAERASDLETGDSRHGCGQGGHGVGHRHLAPLL